MQIYWLIRLGQWYLILLHSERPKLHRVLAVLSAIGLKGQFHRLHPYHFHFCTVLNGVTIRKKTLPPNRKFIPLRIDPILEGLCHPRNQAEVTKVCPSKNGRKSVMHPYTLIHCILVDSSNVICWTSPLVILGVLGLFCCFYSTFN